MPWRAVTAAGILAVAFIIWAGNLEDHAAALPDARVENRHVLIDRGLAEWRAKEIVPPRGRIGYRDEYAGPNPPPELMLDAILMFEIVRSGLIPVVVEKDGRHPVRVVWTRTGALTVVKQAPGANP
jgi:hypothetical protein